MGTYYTIEHQDRDGVTFTRAVQVANQTPKPIGPWSAIPGKAEYDCAIAGLTDTWVPGGGGNETPIVQRNGDRWLWCYNPGQGRHAYINLETDIEVPEADVLNMEDRT
jgi:hypothetical protein